MKKTLLAFMMIVAVVMTTYGGGLLTNTNQSATWVRLPARNASTGIDAVYYNPAGLMKLENGLHFSLSNQSIFQTREITNDYSGPGGTYGLNEHVYKGTAKALAFPSIYAVYKMEKLAISFGFNPVGGGGAATFEKGLPSFELSPSDLVPSLASQGATAYRLNAYFEGSSVFLGFQGGLSYKLSDWLSVGAGVRYVTAENTYNGYLKGIELNMSGTWKRADAVFSGIVANLNGLMAIPTSLQPLVTGGAGTLTLDQAAALGNPAFTPTNAAAIKTGLAAIGVSAAQANAMNLTQVQGAFTQATPTLTAKRNVAAATATLLVDQGADVEQSGKGITPFFSVNISPSEKLNIGIKYEMATKLELKNKTAKDFTTGYTSAGVPITMFPNGGLTRNDMPAMLTLGIDYSLSTAWKLSVGSNYYFDKSADYGHKSGTTPLSNDEIIDQNGLSLQLGLEWKLSDKFLLSSGYSWANKGVNAKYQSDLTYGLSTQTVGFGGGINLTKKIQFNLGVSNTFYKSDEKTIDHILSGTTTNIPALETYKKNTFLFGIGLDFSF